MARGQFTILATNPSSSSPGKVYEVRRGGDGVLYCTCRGWTTHKHCWHLDSWKASHPHLMPQAQTTVAAVQSVAVVRPGAPARVAPPAAPVPLTPAAADWRQRLAIPAVAAHVAPAQPAAPAKADMPEQAAPLSRFAVLEVD